MFSWCVLVYIKKAVDGCTEPLSFMDSDSAVSSSVQQRGKKPVETLLLFVNFAFESIKDAAAPVVVFFLGSVLRQPANIDLGSRRPIYVNRKGFSDKDGDEDYGKFWQSVRTRGENKSECIVRCLLNYKGMPANEDLPRNIFNDWHEKFLCMLDTWLKVDADVFRCETKSVEEWKCENSCINIVLFCDYWVCVRLFSDLYVHPRDEWNINHNVCIHMTRYAYVEQGFEPEQCLGYKDIDDAEYRSMEWRIVQESKKSQQVRNLALFSSQHDRLGQDSALGQTLGPDILQLLIRDHDTTFEGRVEFSEILGIANARRNAILAAHEAKKGTVSQGLRMCMSCGLRIAPTLGIQ